MTRPDPLALARTAGIYALAALAATFLPFFIIALTAAMTRDPGALLP